MYFETHLIVPFTYKSGVDVVFKNDWKHTPTGFIYNTDIGIVSTYMVHHLNISKWSVTKWLSVAKLLQQYEHI